MDKLGILGARFLQHLEIRQVSTTQIVTTTHISGTTSETTVTSNVVQGAGSLSTTTPASTTTTSPTMSSSAGVVMSSDQPTSTTTTATQSPSSVSAVHSSTTGQYTTAALAGAIVGSALGAALVAFIITALVCVARNKRQKGQSRRPPGASDTGLGVRRNRDAGLATSEKGLLSSDGPAWESYLPQSADDKTIRQAVKTFFSQVELHVDNYYRSNTRVVDVDAKRLNDVETGKLPGTIIEVMGDRSLVLPAIKHCISSILIGMATPAPGTFASLLPERLGYFPHKLQDASLPPRESLASQQAYSQWRLLNAYLYPRPQDDRQYQRYRDQSAEDVAGVLLAAFEPWQAPVEDRSAIRQNYRGLSIAAANMGMLLMAQPSRFEFRWTAVGTESRLGNFVMLPGLWKMTDERGCPLDQLLLSPTAVQD